jgi:4-hydroxyphenylpyruvate dioxygenase
VLTVLEPQDAADRGGMTASATVAVADDPLALLDIDHLGLWVGNARQAAHYYRTALGFTPVAYAGPETGVRDRASYVLVQGDVRIVLTAGLHPGSPVTRHVQRHGDGVRDVALGVVEAVRAFDAAVARGAGAVREPWQDEDDAGVLRRATIATYGDTVHTLVDRHDYRGLFAPGYEPLEAAPDPLPPAGLMHIDHVVGNVELGAMDRWVGFYERVLGFSQLVHFDDQAISTEYSALMSKVVWDGEGRVKLPINEPAAGRRKSQIEEFLEFNEGPGVQHVALATDDIVASVRALRARGVEFLRVPDTYYEDLAGRFADVQLDLEAIAELGILADRDEEGHLLQIFTRNVQDRPTVFYELIERHGSRGFGAGNFKALFIALEREQARRGNL